MAASLARVCRRKGLAREIIATGQAHNAYVGVSLDPTVTGGAAVAKNSSTAGAAPKRGL